MKKDFQGHSLEKKSLEMAPNQCYEGDEKKNEYSDFEQLISSITRQFVKSNFQDTDQLVNSALEAIGKFTGVDRSYFFLNDEDEITCSCNHMWCADGISSNAEMLQNLVINKYSWWNHKMFNNEIICLDSIDKIPESSKAIREILQKRSISSILIVPVNYGDTHLGFVGFDSVKIYQKKWTSENILLLRMMADIMAGHFNSIRSILNLKKSKEKYRFFMNNIEEAVVVIDENGRLNYVNSAACLYYEKEESELLHKTVFEIYEQDFASEVLKDVQSVIGSGLPLKKEYCFFYDGIQRWFEGRIQPFYEENEEVSKVFVFAKDVHDRKMREIKLKELNLKIQQYNEALEEIVEERTRENKDLTNINKIIVETSGAMIISADSEGIIESFNPMAEKLLGYTAEEVVGRMPVMSLHDPEEVRDIVKLAENEAGEYFSSPFKALMHLIEYNSISHQEVTYVCKNGRRFPVLLSVRGLKDEDDTNVHSVGVAMDISVHKRAEAALKLQNELKSRLVSMASHEFRTPLSSIMMAADSLDVYFPRMSEGEIHKKLERIKANVLFLKSMMERVLDLSHVENGKMNIKTEKDDFAAFFKTIIQKYQGHEKSLTIHLEMKAERVICHFDKQMMKEVIVNIMENALKYAYENSEIFVTMGIQGDEVWFSIKDSGIGIPQKDQQQIFDAFHRATNVGSIRGTGLGLPLTKEFVRLHRGDIGFVSVEGEGTTFKVTFPVGLD